MSFTSLKSSLTFSTSEKFPNVKLTTIWFLTSEIFNPEAAIIWVPWVAVQVVHRSDKWPVFPARLQVRNPSEDFFYESFDQHKILLLPPAAGTLCWVPEPAILVTHNCPHKPGIACRTEIPMHCIVVNTKKVHECLNINL